MVNPQMYAVSIEHTLCNIFECERFGFGGIVNSDFIRKYPVHAMINGLAFIYATIDTPLRSKVDNFIDSLLFYADMSIDTLLSFDTNSKVIDGITIGLDDENGKIALERIIEEYHDFIVELKNNL